MHVQPRTQDELFRALQAAAACPTGSIRTATPQPLMKQVVSSFPHAIPEVSGPAVAVYHNGFHSRRSFGAASYLVVREGGNVLIDSPRFFGPLEQRIRAMGGVHYMFLTHRDDVADHELWCSFYHCLALSFVLLQLMGGLCGKLSLSFPPSQTPPMPLSVCVCVCVCASCVCMCM